MWAAVRGAASVLRADAVALALGDPAEAEVLTAGFGKTGKKLFTAHFTVGHFPSRGESIELGWSDGRARVDRDTEIAVELLCDQVSVALDRLRSEEVTHPLRALRRVVGLRN